MIGGSPAGVVAAADGLRGAGRALDDAGESVGVHGRSVTAEWEGSASEAAGEAIHGVRSATLTVADAVADCERVYATYADELSACQAAWEFGNTEAVAGEAGQRAAAMAADRADSRAVDDPQRGPALDAARSASTAAGRRASEGRDAMADAVAREARANQAAADAVDAVVGRLDAVHVNVPGQSSGAPMGPFVSAAAEQAAWWTLDSPGASSPAVYGPPVPTKNDDPGEDDAYDDGDPWWREAWYATSGAAQDVGYDALDFATSVADYYRENPDEYAQLLLGAATAAAGMATFTAGSGMEVGGVALDATGVGAIGGVPLNIAGAGAMAAGATAIGTGGAMGLDSMSTMMAKRHPVSGPRPQSLGRKPDGETLGENITRKTGIERKPGEAAHHIVAGKQKPAEKTREILDKFGIDINDADNGVYLPGNKNSPGAGTGPSTHSTLHTDEYYRQVERRLSRARSREEAVDILDDIRKDLQSGWAPR